MKRLILPIALVSVCMSGAFAQERLVKGRVLDEAGEPLAGATVIIKGTQTGTAADDNGNFQISVTEPNTVLVISYYGMEDQEVAAGDGSRDLRMVMKSTGGSQLTGVVVTALGIKKEKKSLGYSVSEVSSDLIEKSGERNAIQSLAAKAPGVQVTSTSGTPGASSKITLRGNSTFTGSNSPLIVVDGIPIDNSTSQPVAGDNPFNANLSGVNEANRALDINPDDIENVTVLKGPAAAALYGANGANGAIIITTKKGKYGEKNLGITFTSSVEINRVSKLPEKQTTYSQGAGGQYSVGRTPNSWGARMDTLGLPVYDNYDNFYQTGLGFNNSLSLSGGTDKTVYRASIGNYNTRGVVPNSYLGRTNASLTAETKLADWLTVGAYGSYTYTDARMVQNGSNVAGPALSLYRMPSSYNILDDWYDPESRKTSNYVVSYDNPLFTVWRNPYTTVTNRMLGNTYFSATLTKDLKLSYKLGVDAYGTSTRQIYDLGSRGNDFSDGTGQVNRSATNFMQLYSDAMLRYNKTFGKLGFGAMLGHNYWYQENKFDFMRGMELTVPNIYNLAVATTLYASNTESYNRSQALYGEVNLSWDSYLYFNATVRNEWNTAFGKTNNSFIYPSANVSWIFSEHLESQKTLSYGKLRLALSKAGVPPSLYSDRNYYTQPFLTDGTTNGNGFPYDGRQGYMTSNVNQPGGLRPETVTGKEVGLELKFWKGRLNFEGTYYHQTSNDLILIRPVAPSSGYQNEYINAGQMINKGVELMLNGDVYKSKDWSINLGINWSKNVSDVTKLADGLEEVSIESAFTGIGSYAIVGQPYGALYGTYWERNDAGQILVDQDGYPITTGVAKNIGNPNPDWLMGINGNFSYKGLTLSMLWDIRKGGDIWNGTISRLNNVGIAAATADRERDYVVDGVYADGPNAGQANATPIPAEDYWRYYKGDLASVAENAIEDGSWVRLRSVGLSYRFVFNKERNPFKYVELGFTGRNLFLHTKYSGVDPETSLTGAGSNIGGFDYFNNPGTKSYIFNLRFGL